jgi:hypothetical protein
MTAKANIPFQTIDWNTIEKTIHPGQTGSASWQTLQWPGLRELSSHRSHTTTGVKLLIIDGAFLKHL